jgi:hypothetical protein
MVLLYSSGSLIRDWIISGIIIGGGKPNNAERYLIECHSVHHKSHMNCPGIDPGSLL